MEKERLGFEKSISTAVIWSLIFCFFAPMIGGFIRIAYANDAVIAPERNPTIIQSAQEILESVSIPQKPRGVAKGDIIELYGYSASGSRSNLRHPVQYFFDWGDMSNSGWLPTGTTKASKSWSFPGVYNIKVQARCAEHTSVVSSWSKVLAVTIKGPFSSSKTAGIQEAIDALPLEGGMLFLPSGTYVLKASILLRSNIQLIGAGSSTVLKHADETKSKLLQDAHAGENQVVVENPNGFEVGMDVVVEDDTYLSNFGTLGRITAINGNTLTLDSSLDGPYTVSNNGFAVNSFPVIRDHQSEWSSGIQIKSLKIDGNNKKVGIHTWGGGIYFGYVTDSIVEDVWIDNSSCEGFMDFGHYNQIVNNIISNAAKNGIHIGAQNNIIMGNIIKNSGGLGVYFCWMNRYNIVSNNQITGNLLGIGYLDDDPTGGDKYNIIEDNVISNNKQHGIYCYNTSYDSLINNTITNNSQLSPGIWSGIYLNNITNFIVDSNLIIDNQDQKTQAWGIYEGGTSDYNVFIGNIVNQNLVGGLSLVGPNDLVVEFP